MRTQQALLSTAWLILGLLLTAGESPSERIVSKCSSTAHAKSISFQEVLGARNFEVRIFNQAEYVAERIENGGDADSFADILNVCALSCAER